MFKIGQEVICIRSLVRKLGMGYGHEKLPLAGVMYHIRDIGAGLHLGRPEGLAVRLEEIVNPITLYQGGEFEPAFDVNRFRPIIKRKTDIAIFTEMLTETKIPSGVA